MSCSFQLLVCESLTLTTCNHTHIYSYAKQMTHHWCWHFAWALVALAQFIAYLVYTAVYPGIYKDAIPLTQTSLTGPPGANGTFHVTQLYSHYYPMIAIIVMFMFASLQHCMRGVRVFQGVKEKGTDDNGSSVPFKNSYSRRSVGGENTLGMNDRMMRLLGNILTATIMTQILLVMMSVADFWAIVGLSLAPIAMLWFVMQGDRLTAGDKWVSFGYAGSVGLLPWVVIFWQMAIINLGVGVATLTYGMVFFMFFMFLFAGALEIGYIYNSFDATPEGQKTSRGLEKGLDAVDGVSQIVLAVLVVIAMRDTIP